MTGRKFGKATYTHSVDVAPGAQELVLTQYPIRSVEYVKDTDTGQDIDPDSYDFTMTGDVGVLYRDTGWIFRGTSAAWQMTTWPRRDTWRSNSPPATSFRRTPRRMSLATPPARHHRHCVGNC